MKLKPLQQTQYMQPVMYTLYICCSHMNKAVQIFTNGLVNIQYLGE